MKKIIAGLLMVAVLAGCGAEVTPSAAPPPTVNPDSTAYYNGYFGVKINVDPDWAVIWKSSHNLKLLPDSSFNYEDFQSETDDKYPNENYYDFIDVANIEDSNNPDQAEMQVFLCEPGVSLSVDDYVKQRYAFDAKRVYGNGDTLEFMESTHKTINGVDFALFKARYQINDGGAYIQESYITKTLDDFITMYITYWDGSDTASAAAAALARAVEIVPKSN